MAKTAKNKYPADKAGTKYSEFKNTKRTPPKIRVEEESKQSTDDQSEAKNP